MRNQPPWTVGEIKHTAWYRWRLGAPTVYEFSSRLASEDRRWQAPEPQWRLVDLREESEITVPNGTPAQDGSRSAQAETV
jgi:hypothetical protein